jgi:hypothetical protein
MELRYLHPAVMMALLHAAEHALRLFRLIMIMLKL